MLLVVFYQYFVNQVIVVIFNEIVDLLEVEEVNLFWVCVYCNVVCMVEGMMEGVDVMLVCGVDLIVLLGVGVDFVVKMCEIVEMGICVMFICVCMEVLLYVF